MIEQDTAYTIDHPNTDVKYRVVAYGDSIFAGFAGHYDVAGIFSVAKRAAPWVYGEYASNAWNADVEVVRRARPGAKAEESYMKIVNELIYVDDPDTRSVMFQMCRNDYLQARITFESSCNFVALNAALTDCALYTEQAMQAINQHAQRRDGRPLHWQAMIWDHLSNHDVED